MSLASRRPDAALLGAAAVWGITFVVVQDAVAAVPPFRFVAVRFGLAFLLLLPFVATRLRSARIWLDGGIVGLALFAGFGLQTWGLTDTTPSRAAFLTGLSVVLVPFLALAFHRRPPTRHAWIGVVLSTTGLFFLTGARFEHWTRGDTAELGCAFAFAAHILLLDRCARRHPPFALLAVTCLAVVAISAPIGLWREPPGRWSDPAAIVGVGVTVLLATIGAFGAQNWAQRVVTPTRTALILLLEPVFAAAASAWAGRETFGVGTLAGGALILAGMAVAEFPQPRTGSDGDARDP